MNTSSDDKLVRGLGLLDSTMLVAGSMIGSGVFIVSADIARQVGSAGWLLVVWGVTGVLTMIAALTYGELAAMMPKAGGQYVYLREAYGPLWGFLYGWTLFLVIQTGTIAAVAVAFSRFLGVLAPGISATNWIVSPVILSRNYALSLSTQQIVAVGIIVVLTFVNTRGLPLGKWIQNVFTSAKTLSLLALIVLGIFIGRNAGAVAANFSHFWAIGAVKPIKSDLATIATMTAKNGAIGMIIAIGVAQVGSLFSADAWNNVTFTAGEVRDPKRNLPLSLAMGTALVITLYLLANVAYLCVLPLVQIQNAPDDRVGTAAMAAIFGGAGAGIMAVAIMVSTFGCCNGLILAGARVYYAMAQDRLFFKSTGRLNAKHVPAMALVLQGIWTALLVLPRTRLRDPITDAPVVNAQGIEQYGNLYGALLDYVVFAVLIFYILTIAGVFVLRRKQPEAERPYRAFGYPILPLIYLLGATTILIVLAVYRTQTSWPGILIVLAGVPVYFLWGRSRPAR
ncbi:MAG: amino acid permease [Verrucomicrobiota bacterium]|nr:amino acid permease [Verrucomicrobiota bacterium]